MQISKSIILGCLVVLSLAGSTQAQVNTVQTEVNEKCDEETGKRRCVFGFDVAVINSPDAEVEQPLVVRLVFNNEKFFATIVTAKEDFSQLLIFPEEFNLFLIPEGCIEDEKEPFPGKKTFLCKYYDEHAKYIAEKLVKYGGGFEMYAIYRDNFFIKLTHPLRGFSEYYGQPRFDSW